MKKRKKILVLSITVILVLFAFYAGVWLAYRHLRYGEFEKATDGSNGVVAGDYLCATFVPSVLRFRGNLSISERTQLDGRTGGAKDVTCDMLVFPKLLGGYEIYIVLLDNGTNTLPNGMKSMKFELSEKMELLNAEEDVRACYDAHRDKILGICGAAQEVFGIFDMRADEG